MTTNTETATDASKVIAEDPKVRADLQVRLAEIAVDMQRVLNERAQQELEAGDRRDKAANESTAGARTFIRAQMEKSLLLSSTPAVISYAIVIGFFVVLAIMATGRLGVSGGPDLDKVAEALKAATPESARALAGELERSRTREDNIFQIFNILVGALATAFATVMNFWLGSSLGSRQKDAVASDVQTTQAAVIARQQPAAPPPAAPDKPDPGDDAPGPDAPSPPVTPASRDLIGQILPELTAQHGHFPKGAQWRLTPTGIAVDGAAAAGTPGEPKTVRNLWKLYGADCATAATRLGVPVELIVATIATESRGDPNARRREPRIGDESVGLMQTLVRTARAALGRPTLKADDLLDPRTSIDAGAAYIAQQRTTTHFDPPLVAAAYNAGSLRPDTAAANRWQLVCYPVGTGEHVNRFVAWFNDCMVAAAADGWGRDGVPSFASAFASPAAPVVATPAPGPAQRPPAAAGSSPPAPPISRRGQDFPPKPSFLPLQNTAARQALFGPLDFAPDPNKPDRILIRGDWEARNIVTVEVTRSGLKGKPGPLAFPFHVKAADQLRGMWAAWESAGLLDRIETFDGSFVPRMIRGSTTSLSCHAFGCAFDINAAFNPLNQMPALVGSRGSVRELVEIANTWGFFWGGHFRTRLDGMHFEVAQIRT